jgi:hypothetical protein
MGNISRMAAVGVLAAGGILAAATPAAADPVAPACAVNPIRTGVFTVGAEARCNGSGPDVRVVIECYTILVPGYNTKVGPWVSIPGVSTASCTAVQNVTSWYAEFR